jgi:hypothetical protein
MHSRRKPHIGTLDTEIELQRPGIYESLHQFRMRKQHQPPIEVVPKQIRASTPHGDVPNDLDRIACATTEAEVLDLLNQVLGVLQRTGRMAELPAELRMETLTNLQEVRIALRRLQGDLPFTERVDWDSDALCVLRCEFTAAEERVRQLRRRE